MGVFWFDPPLWQVPPIVCAPVEPWARSWRAHLSPRDPVPGKAQDPATPPRPSCAVRPGAGRGCPGAGPYTSQSAGGDRE